MRPTPFLLALTFLLTLPAPAQQNPPAVPTIRVYSRETIVDIVVTDAEGKPVRGLSKSAFTVQEDGKPEPIRSFGEFDAETTAPNTAPRLPSDIHTNLAAAPTTGPVNIILIDALHSNWVSAVRALQATGAYGPLFLRVGVLDSVSNKVGTLEIPLTVPKNQRLSF